MNSLDEVFALWRRICGDREHRAIQVRPALMTLMAGKDAGSVTPTEKVRGQSPTGKNAPIRAERVCGQAAGLVDSGDGGHDKLCEPAPEDVR